MKRLFLKLTDSKARYWMFDGAQTKNFILSDLVWFLESWGNVEPQRIYTSRGMNWEWLHLSKTEDGKNVYLWDGDLLKDRAPKEGLSEMEQDAYDAAYDAYTEKRWFDMPMLHMSIENYVEIVKKWQKIVLQDRPNYIIVSQDDAGYVDLVGKNELSPQDLQDMACEHEKFLKYQVAYEKYQKSRPDIVDDLWHGPESNEYESDWQKFLDEPLD